MGYFSTLGQALLGRGFSRALSGKASAVGPMIARFMTGQAVWPGRDFEQLAREGYQQNAVVYRSVGLIADCVAQLPIIAYKGKGKDRVEIDQHPVLDLLRTPNPQMSGTDLIKALVSYYKIAGNAYIERTSEDDPAAMELYAWRPDRTRIVPGADGFVQAYEYSVGGQRRRIDVDIDTTERPILHFKTFNPLNDWYGQSPLDSCAWAIDITNESAAWNLGILKNSGAPSGAFVYSGNAEAGGAMPENMYEQMKREITDQISGSRNAGKVLLLEGGVDWKQMSLDPERMQYIESAMHAARQIAFTLGVPPMMLGIPGDNTYSNYKEARQAFYQDTVIPLAKRITHALEMWFARQLGKDVHLDVNVDNLHALADAQKDMWMAVQQVSFLSTNEKREAVGYAPVDGGDDVYIGAGQIPLSMSGPIAGAGAEADPAPKPKSKPPAAGKGLPYLQGTVHQRNDLP